MPDDEKRVHFVVSMDPENDLLEEVDTLFKLIQAKYPDRRPSVGISTIRVQTRHTQEVRHNDGEA